MIDISVTDLLIYCVLFQMQKLDPEMKALFEHVGLNQESVDEETVDFIYDFVEKHGGLNAVKEDLARQKRAPPAPPTCSYFVFLCRF